MMTIPDWRRTLRVLVTAVLVGFSPLEGRGDEIVFRLVRREMKNPPSEQTQLSMVSIKLPGCQVEIVECRPELPDGCRVFFDQWGQGVCLFPTGNGTAAERAKEVIAEWNQKYQLDIAAFPREFTGTVGDKQVQASVDYVARNPKGHGCAMLLKETGLLISDHTGGVQRSLLKPGIWAPPSWDCTGEFLAFALNDPPTSEHRFRCMVFSRPSGNFIPVGREFSDTLIDSNFAENPIVRPRWKMHVQAFSFLPMGKGFIWRNKEWEELRVGFGLGIPNTNLYVDIAGREGGLLLGRYIFADDGQALLRFPSKPRVHYLLPLTPDAFVGYTSRSLGKELEYTYGIFSATGKKRADLPAGHYAFLDSSDRIYREFDGPENALAWLDKEIDTPFTDEWNGLCRVYPNIPPWPDSEICSQNSAKATAELRKVFRELMVAATSRDELWHKYDGSATLKEYLETHPEVKCPIGGVYTVGARSQLVACSIHEFGQHKD